MSKLIRRTIDIKKRGTALIVALQLTFITLLSLVSFVGGPQQKQQKQSAHFCGRLASERGRAGSV